MRRPQALKSGISSILVLSLSFTPVLAQEKLTYPELEVTPRATARLKSEANIESKGRFLNYWPIQLSAITTILAANQGEPDRDKTEAEKEDYNDRRDRTTLMGAAWIIFTGALSAGYTPYRDGYKEIEKLPYESMRDQLTKERLAEEALYRPTTTAKVLNWLSVATNLYGASMLLEAGTNSAKSAAGLAALVAFTPLLVDNKWESVERSHREYKKKIYGPVSGPVVLPVGDRQFAYGAGLKWSF